MTDIVEPYTSWRIGKLPPTVGYYKIGGTEALTFHLPNRPRWLTRLMCRWLLEWVWVDKP